MEEMWFGTKQKFQWVPMPERGVQRRNVFADAAGTLQSGGAFASPSYGRHIEYGFDFAVSEAHGSAGLDVFQEYATGVWNDFATVVDGFNPNDLIYPLDPMNVEQNLCPPHFAAPMLGLTGDWPWIGTYVSHAATAANSYGQPQRTVTFSVTQASATLPAETRRKMVIPIPPGYTLRWGWSGASTGTGVVRSESHNRSTGAIVASNAAALSATASTRLNQSINGDTYDYVTIGIARTSSATSTVAITSMLAVLHPNAESPALTGSHARGMGITGCRFLGTGIPEDYYLVDESSSRHLKGLSFGLIEIGAWL